eukprot:1147734-Pelagomonas_calceolata.AAC.1
MKCWLAKVSSPAAEQLFAMQCVLPEQWLFATEHKACCPTSRSWLLVNVRHSVPCMSSTLHDVSFPLQHETATASNQILPKLGLTSPCMVVALDAVTEQGRRA